MSDTSQPKQITLAMWDDIRKTLNTIHDAGPHSGIDPRATLTELGHRHGWTPDEMQRAGLIEPPPKAAEQKPGDRKGSRTA